AADRLVVLDKGRVVETGQHADLVGRKNGVYARLHRTQMETYGLPICDLRFAIEGREAG
ncbi:MAG: hypothetical protein JWO87_2683, partial [Phycisphaerales bacterium]|nr:hypothetical protein [Phycisphaerales bacterium]